MKGKMRLGLAALFAAGVLCTSSAMVFAAEEATVQTKIEKLFSASDNIASGVVNEDYGQITWVIDGTGKLTVTGTGDVSDEYEHSRSPWYAYREEITSAEVNVSGMTEAYALFSGCNALKEVDLSGFDTTSVTLYAYMFEDCSSIEELDLSGFDTSGATYLGQMFYGCSALKKIDLGGFDTGNVMSLWKMFAGCGSLEEIDLSSFDTSSVQSMGEMFSGCSSLKELDLSGFDTGNVVYMSEMFSGCSSLEELDLSGFDMSSVTDADGMFYGCNSLKQIETPINCSCETDLPKQSEADQWYLPDGTAITALPQGLSESVTINKRVLVYNVFDDVAEGTWYTDSVQYVYDNGIMEGNGGLFTPNGKMTRAMFVTTLYRLVGEPEIIDYSACEELKDVSEGAWYTDAVCWAYSTGVTTGYENDKTFRMNNALTREQLATFLYRYAQYQDLDISQSDELSGLLNADKVKAYAQKEVKWAVGAGLISGLESKDANGATVYDLAPQGTATRAQMAKILMNFCEAYHI